MTNTHPKSVFRWEDAASLEHACWACPTKANSPRALQTCYGIHSMPCASYHPTMHAIGAAHRCSGCAVAREMHDARHREIAELVSEYHSLHLTGQEKPNKPNVLSERSANVPQRARQGTSFGSSHLPLQYGHNTAVDDSGIEGIENEPSVEDDALSTVSSNPSTTPTTPLATITPRKPSAAEKRAAKRARKSANSQFKAIKNQQKNPVHVTSVDVERIALILHGNEVPPTDAGSLETHPLATDRGIEDVIARNLKFVKAIQAHKAYLRSTVAAGRRENRERRYSRRKLEWTDGEEVEIDDIVDVILCKLGVKAAASAGVVEHVCLKGTPLKALRGVDSSVLQHGVSCPTKKGGGAGANDRSSGVILARLRGLIRQDLEKHENEVQQMYIRAGGFWRYVGRTVFERMTAVAEEMDVRSGEKKLAKVRTGGGADVEDKEE